MKLGDTTRGNVNLNSSPVQAFKWKYVLTLTCHLAQGGFLNKSKIEVSREILRLSDETSQSNLLLSAQLALFWGKVSIGKINAEKISKKNNKK